MGSKWSQGQREDQIDRWTGNRKLSGTEYGYKEHGPPTAYLYSQ